MRHLKSHVIVFLASLLVFVGLDAVWLLQFGVPMFQSRIGAILRPEPLLAAAAVFYVLYATGIVILAVLPAMAARSLAVAAFNGAILGLTAYATFDLTNLAVIKGWTVGLAAIDMSWGVVATALTSMAGYTAGVRSKRSLKP